MKEKFENKYIAWGVTLFSVFSALILLFFAIYRWDYIFGFIQTLFTIMMPFIYGVAIAYIMNPIVKFFENKVFAVFLAEPISDIMAATVTGIVFFTQLNKILKKE